jgi:tRNA threonylcarbamoyladenosine biosynthesis protein TsaE
MLVEMDCLSKNVRQTEAIASELAATLGGGECIAIYGELGAGKTQFVRGLATALGVNPRAVSSPTFVLLNVYNGGRLPVFHLDAYRIHGDADLEAIGFSEMLEQKGVVIVEWADRVAGLLPAKRLDVRIETVGESQRQITIRRS